MRFAKANRKLQKLAKELGVRKSEIRSFDLPAGYTCPGAKDCLARADRKTGKLKDGPDTEFRCYAASAEAMYKQTREFRWANFDSVRLALREGVQECAELLLSNLPKTAKIIRIHTSGDFFSADYLQAWVWVASARPDIQFYAYTKSLGIIAGVEFPDNLHVNISMGGKWDHLAHALPNPKVYVVADELVALGRKLLVDTTDGIACSTNVRDFALVVHGVQPVGGHRLAA